VRNPKSLEFHS